MEVKADNVNTTEYNATTEQTEENNGKDTNITTNYIKTIVYVIITILLCVIIVTFIFTRNTEPSTNQGTKGTIFVKRECSRIRILLLVCNKSIWKCYRYYNDNI